MFLHEIRLSDYRNYEQIHFCTNAKVNLFIGKNAQGKTNLLEAIYVLALTKSHRTKSDKELIRFEQNSCHIQAQVEKKHGHLQLDLQIMQRGKKVKINGLEQKKLSDYVGQFNVVMFAPQDLDLVKDGPQVRRRFLDMEIGQIYPSYIYDVNQYAKVLEQRNHYLKNGFAGSVLNPQMIEVWNEQLALYGSKIMVKRQNFISQLQSFAQKTHAGITKDQESLRLEYKPSFEYDFSAEQFTLIEQFMLKLREVKEQEMRRGITLIGPHRDDLCFFINDHDVQTFGSQGQQRTTALSLKLAEVEFIRQEVGEYPILLLDDVLSELDEERQLQLVETFRDKVQIFITSTGVEASFLQKLKEASTYHIHQASIKEIGGA